jgi:transcriptional regulator with XRE-family HTH domain
METHIVNDSTEFGAVLRKRRGELGYTQQDVVSLAPFGSTFFSDLENGKETAHLGKAIMAARMLGFHVILQAPVSASSIRESDGAKQV